MEIITMFLSGLALLAAISCLILILREKKRNQKRNVDFANLLRVEITACTTEITRMLREFDAESKQAYDEQMRKLDLILSALNGKFEEIGKKISDLESGVVPDYNEALKAKESVDLFNEGISGILGFNPMEAVKKSRQEKTYGGEVE